MWAYDFDDCTNEYQLNCLIVINGFLSRNETKAVIRMATASR